MDPAPEPPQFRCVALRPRRAVVLGLAAALLLCGAGFIGSLLALFGILPDLVPLGFLGLHLGALAAWGLYSHLQRGAYARPVEGTLQATRAGLTFTHGEAVVRIERAAIRDGYFQPHSSGSTQLGTLRVLGPMRRVLFETQTEHATARAVLRALGLDASAHRATFTAASPAMATAARQIGLTVALLLLVRVLPAYWYLPAGPLSLLPLLAVLLWPARITIGTDGFLHRWLLWRRFVPMSELASVEPEGERGITLALGTAQRLTWYAVMRQKTTTQAQVAHRDALLLRMRESLAVARSRPRATHLTDTVARAGRSHREWLAALDTLQQSGLDYRTSAISRDDLWHLMEDPTAPEDARAGAAYVLRAGSAAEDLERMRDAADATVSPRLRIALDSAADDDPEELAEALEILEVAAGADGSRART